MSRKHHKYHKPKMTLPVSIVAGFMPGVTRVVAARSGGLTGIASEAGRIFIGYDMATGKFNMNSMMMGTLPIILGVLVHKIANALGVNRFLASKRIPFIRL